ncbi:uncharacterized protein BCR38DRAFT_456408 [Pseudomassariella vexata]|uniref:MYND-type domain-containing protein n=1 Tax=Pseudomassariella vexata TaxID=1141098 RepID=A0A1Y2E849_9PEZI|nr:uncharacterized protein BCR38DRAFT_456408 [Pseudomassariella vexata]ORY67743.1 hypothetical protein BCR38DRAFT_456408 [Pseudomassariella vexata]
MNLGLPFRACSSPGCPVRFNLLSFLTIIHFISIVCPSTNLLQCGGCRVVVYCGPEHQKAQWRFHKTTCNLIKESREKLRAEEAALRAHPPDPFKSVPGNFWSWSGTRPYMQARHDLMSATLNVRTGEAVQIALDNCLETLRLCREDNLGVREQVPSLYLRLGRDQDAFDFLKWYDVCVTDTYDWSDMDLPFLDLRDQDAFAPCDLENCSELAFLVAMANLKMKLLLDMKMLQVCIKKHGNKDFETKMEWVRQDAMTDIVYKRRDILERDDYAEIISSLEKQVRTTYGRVKKANKHYWPALQDPDRYASVAPTTYAPGSREQVVLTFRYTWYT